MSEIVVTALAGVVIGGLLSLGAFIGFNGGKTFATRHACGECDHVGECGDYECRPGVDGWQLKAGER